MSNIPEKIYLRPTKTGGILLEWQRRKVLDTDIEYIRSDVSGKTEGWSDADMIAFAEFCGMQYAGSKVSKTELLTLFRADSEKKKG